MKFLRKQLPWGVAVLLAVSAVVFGGSPASAEPSEETVCAEAASAEEAQLNICYRAFCHEESDCWDACPAALSVSCTRGVCYYQQPTGGGGGGGPVCPQQFCGSDFDCSCNGQPGVCGANNTCYY